MAAVKDRAWTKINTLIAQLIMSVTCLAGCTNRPTDAQLETWRQEAIARNAEMVAIYAKETEQLQWNLVVQGQISAGKQIQLNWQQLQELATTHVKTRDPNHTSNVEEILDFRGVPISTLLYKFGATESTEVTFVAADGFQATVSLADLRRYPIILAVERDGKAISRSEGGPLYLVFPHTQFPELRQKYSDKFWPYYVTHAIVGTEPVRLHVGGRELNLPDLEKLPQVTKSELVKYKVGWPNGKVKLQGVRVRDILATTGVKLPKNGAVIVRGKPLVYSDSKKPVRLSSEMVNNCDPMLVTHWGDNRQAIAAQLGGPVTLAIPSSCQSETNEQPWVSFVEELEVTAP